MGILFAPEKQHIETNVLPGFFIVYKKVTSSLIDAFIIGNLAEHHFTMKRFLILLLTFFGSMANAQYFDWNKILFSVNNQGGLAWYNDHSVAVDGNQIVQFTMRPCLFCNTETIECYVDTNGNTTNFHNNYMNGYRKSYFDQFSNLIQITKAGPHYNLQYFLQNTINFSIPDTVPDFVDGDCYKNLYLFFRGTVNSRICIYDSTGVYIKSLYLPGERCKPGCTGAIYMLESNLALNTATVKKYNSSGLLINSYGISYYADQSLSPADFIISKNSGKVWGVLNNDIVCYDSTGTLISSIPVLDNSHVSIAVDDNDQLYIWEGNIIRKYNQNSIIWSTTIDASLTEKINVDHNGNVYYVGNYTEPYYDNTGVFFPTSYYVPPALAFKGYNADPGFGVDPNYNIVLGKINSTSTCTSDLSIVVALQNDLPVTELCSRQPFEVRANFDHLPVASAMDTVYVEISDVSGSFNNAHIIGKGIGLIIPCEIPDAISPGNNYNLRAKMTSSVITSTPFSQQITVKTSPPADLIMENSIDGEFSCVPFTFKTNPGQNYSYHWFSVSDLFGNPYNTYFSGNDSVITLPGTSYEAIGVEVTNNNNGCTVTSNLITPFELDSMNPMDIRLLMPDTFYKNDVPAEIHTPGYLQGIVAGPGVYKVDTDNAYYFFPDSVSPGLNILTRSLSHIGTPCIPIQKPQTIYVDPTLRNIVCGDVDPNDKVICAGDSVAVPFSLLDPSVYNLSNVFIAELCAEDPDNGKLTKIADIGSGAVSPVMCLMPDNRGNKMRFRIRSSQTNEVSTLNANGDITVPTFPYVHFQQNLLTDNCFPTNIALNIYSSFGQHQWFYNDSLILDNINWNVGITPATAGNYTLILTDQDNGCIAKLGPIAVDDSAHIPSLTTTPSYYYLYACGKSYPTITAQTDVLSSLSWYYENNQLPGTSSSLLTFNQGSYKAVATCSSGCTISVFAPKYVYADPIVLLDNPTIASLCSGNSFELSVNDDYPFYAYSYQWVKNNTTVIAANRQVIVTDSGNYFVAVMSSSGCTDTSATTHISTSTVNVPVITPGGPLTISYREGVMLSTNNYPGFTYQWYNMDVPVHHANKSFYFTSQPGLFTVKTTDSYGCTNISLPVTVYHTHRIKHVAHSTLKNAGSETSETTIFNIYPNPSNGQFSLTGRNITDENVHIIISDPYGRIIMEGNYTASEGKLDTEINLEFIADGLYFVSIESANDAESLPLVVTGK